ncbi:hypothetical protein HBB16_09970 [Pseudonocardia sp. MCCB 268]|nr:hypothetical protein [Pseudonocardia cytotoxica]
MQSAAAAGAGETLVTSGEVHRRDHHPAWRWPATATAPVRHAGQRPTLGP